MITEFPRGVHDKLKHYIYLYIDPRNEEVFYAGKGVANRAFSHLKDESEKAKTERIRAIRKDGLQPRIEVLVHGLETDEIAKKVEASIIDLFGIDKLTNMVRGYESREYGRMTVEQVIATYSAEKADITEPCILININRTFRFGMSEVELYDATRSAWKVGDQKDKARYAMAVYHSIVQEVYEIMGWFPGGSTYNTRYEGRTPERADRWEFVGRIADESARTKYVYKDVSEHVGAQNPIKYLNCNPGNIP